MLEAILILTGLTWLAYWGAIKNNFVSDDIEAICNYNGEFRGWDYGNLTKWVFYKLFQKSNTRNHMFSILMHNANVLLLYSFLTHLFNPTLAFMTSALFAVHPVCTQAIAWISARGYPIGLFWTLVGFNLISNAPSLQLLFATNVWLYCLLVAAFVGLYFLGIHAQFAVMATCSIYFFLGHPFLGLIGMAISFGIHA